MAKGLAGRKSCALRGEIRAVSQGRCSGPSGGIGADVQRPLAAVVVFGLMTSTLLTLFVIPAA